MTKTMQKNPKLRKPMQKDNSPVKMTLLPPKQGVCQECATDHTANEPHNAQSLFYQIKFKMDNGRDATWLDAMEKCSDEVKEFWIKELKAKGISI